ncbi:hypothetical protein [Hoyosella altamirensis]|uniref:Uncharacterized protein n=1 Tax=Hoyosella altamirensis TaxID=616997 RepID=A0A839RQU0_9ACTN|nr:hypothetical protein [Hoyosella altamirensis]MBB3039175.1 hypothetical protein [Hoyosella altamirensis]
MRRGELWRIEYFSCQRIYNILRDGGHTRGRVDDDVAGLHRAE